MNDWDVILVPGSCSGASITIKRRSLSHVGGVAQRAKRGRTRMVKLGAASGFDA